MRIGLLTVFMCVMAVAMPGAGHAEASNQIKGESMAQKWEYKTLYRLRYAKREGNIFQPTEWDYMEDGKKIGTLDIQVKLRELGEAGWELVGMSPRSSNPNNPGYSSEETWVFKRAK